MEVGRPAIGEHVSNRVNTLIPLDGDQVGKPSLEVSTEYHQISFKELVEKISSLGT